MRWTGPRGDVRDSRCQEYVGSQRAVLRILFQPVVVMLPLMRSRGDGDDDRVENPSVQITIRLSG